MIDIFSTAETDLVWVGEEENALEAGIKYLDPKSSINIPQLLFTSTQLRCLDGPGGSESDVSRFFAANNQPVFVCGRFYAIWNKREDVRDTDESEAEVPENSHQH